MSAGEREALDVTSPFSGEVVGTVEQWGADEVLATVERQAAVVAGRDRWLPAPQRIEVLRATAALVGAQREELARLIASEGGKPLTDALVEVDRAANGLELFQTDPTAQLFNREQAPVVAREV